MTAIIEARAVSYTVGNQQILRDINLRLRAGERLAVTGPSGSGKTSLLALLAGLAQPTQGEILLDGQRLTGIAGPGKNVATVLQGYGLVALLTASENIEVTLRAAGWTRRDALAAAHAALEQVGLAAHADQFADELSGGQQQRTAVARALAHKPRLLIADEPTAELDPTARAVVLARMMDVADRGGALLLATHDPQVANRCDRTINLATPSPTPTRHPPTT